MDIPEFARSVNDLLVGLQRLDAMLNDVARAHANNEWTWRSPTGRTLLTDDAAGTLDCVALAIGADTARTRAMQLRCQARPEPQAHQPAPELAPEPAPAHRDEEPRDGAQARSEPLSRAAAVYRRRLIERLSDYLRAEPWDLVSPAASMQRPPELLSADAADLRRALAREIAELAEWCAEVDAPARADA